MGNNLTIGSSKRINAAKLIQQRYRELRSDPERYQAFKELSKDEKAASQVRKGLNNIAYVPEVSTKRYIPAAGTNVFRKQSNDEYRSAFLNIMNGLRSLYGRPKLNNKTFDTSSPKFQTSVNRLRGNTSRVHIPSYAGNQPLVQAFGKAGISTVVSPSVNRAVESKSSTAIAIQALRGQGGLATVTQYLERRGVPADQRASLAQRIHTNMRSFTPETGTVHTLSDMMSKIRSRAQKGVVFQLDASAAGRGTLILSSSKITSLLAKSPEQQTQEIVSKLGLASAEQLNAQLQSSRGISWQELIPLGKGTVKEGSVQLSVVNKRKKAAPDGKPLSIGYATTDQYCGPEGEHIGNTVRTGVDRFKKIFPGNSKMDFLFAQEIIIDQMLKQNGFRDGIHDSRANLSLHSVDLLYRNGKSSKPQISEYNARPSFVTRMQKGHQGSATGMDTGYITLGQGVAAKLASMNPVSAARFLQEKCLSPLRAHKGSFFDHLQYEYKSPNNVAISMTVLFKNGHDRQAQLDAIKQIGNKLKAVTTESIDAWSQSKVKGSGVRRATSSWLAKNSVSQSSGYAVG